ncbi:hypothetical protein ES708_07779 [subsurface metagenome]
MSYPSDPELGWYYVVSVAGEVGGVRYEVGDWIVWNGTSWDKLIGKSDVMPVGAVIFYDGVGIANVGTRTVQLGDEVDDTFAMPGWFVCNGLAGTPDLEKMFVRGGLVSGVIEGSDDTVVVQHNHPASQVAHAHKVGTTTEELGSGGPMKTILKNAGLISSGWMDSQQPAVTVDNEGVSGVGKNVPVHYVMIYIKKMN